jgi:predicted nucleic acid-binding protein
MTFLDTSVLVGAVLEKHPQHAACLRALEACANPISDAHALAETFATLTGFYRVPAEAAAELTLGLRAVVRVQALSLANYATAISEARQRGIMGGGIYDSLHATFARRQGARRVITRNPGHFAHAAPEREVIAPC